ncbi:phospholipase D/nuclease [Aureobasidium pullulans]|uniref:phospholipase D n=1 Tax=Aureobasidium pullulans TaxID=5580 RepID=A0A4S9AL31_AURPU|nr:phospholipase D/nuclease [Aureobasidium pullulans]
MSDLKEQFSDHGQTQAAGEGEQQAQSSHVQDHDMHRFQSFAPQRIGNEVKWYVDGAGYMHAVSMALERARESIWIMDWWLSPELYLRRPPAQNEQYRVDRMLQAAAERGVKAHHEKLCLVDDHIAFMGGLDLCYGRWDSWQHSIADAHPGDLNKTVFPGQDFNNARILDFSPKADALRTLMAQQYLSHHVYDADCHQDVAHWDQNKLDRRYNSRMGWSDMSISLMGPVVEDLRRHFAERWNFIYQEKYSSKNSADRYSPLHVSESRNGIVHHDYPSSPDAPLPEYMRERMMERWEESRERMDGFREQVRHHFPNSRHPPPPPPGMPCQIMRSCTKWSHGTDSTEHSIQNAYIEVIRNSHHFIYIENQFFITATGDSQRPIKNQIGAAIVERIVRAAREGEPYHVIVIMPAIPAFAGDLKSDEALGTREILELQYDSINRGGNSIMESIAREGIDPMQYIRFYNLRNYDRINSGGAMRDAEEQSGVSYDDARQDYDQRYGSQNNEYAQGGAYNNEDQQYGGGGQNNRFERYQEATQNIGSHSGLSSGQWDSVASCYMLNGEDIRNVPWEDGTTNEMDAFVSELLYVHSKLLIADDRVVICGSANLNDRSQLGDHDSEIAICIEDPREIDSYMAGRPWRATEFAASLRRLIFRKHLGLLPAQDVTRPDQNFEPIGVPNAYDWGSREDEAVIDPLSSDFSSLWNNTARNNTQAFERVFHPVPSDSVRNWKDYDEYFSRFFPSGKDAKEEKGKEPSKPSQWKLGHVVAEEFPGGVQEVKEVLSQIRGTLVEMPLLFLQEEDIAKEGLTLNAMTEEIYT